MDQRIINPTLPDEPGTKVNRCVEEILRFWREGEAEKLTQLVFSDISTPRASTPRRRLSSPAISDPVIHALEADSPQEKPFTIYEDIRQKLIARGVPAEQIAFIHDAKTEVQKKELFAKMRSGQVRILIGSTQKMGAGTNVQDRLIALHDLDCPWRPRDLTQRKGRIERRGNLNKKVHVLRYVTEGTFDSYFWQTVEKKQQFISQIMTSKAPVRSCSDVDETALSYAEIKALCAGDPRIKERMELDVEVAKLKLMQASHQSQQFRMEDRLIKYFPEQIAQTQGFIRGIEADMETLAAHPHPEKKGKRASQIEIESDTEKAVTGVSEASEKPAAEVTGGKKGFAGIEINGVNYTNKTEAEKALLEASSAVKGVTQVQVGSYRGFDVLLSRESMFDIEITVTLRGKMSHQVDLSSDGIGNLSRMDRLLEKTPVRLENLRTSLDNLYKQQEATKQEIGKPFPQEDELREKSARLTELDALLNIDDHATSALREIAKTVRPSVLEKLDRSLPSRSGKAPGKDKTKHRSPER